MSDSTRIDQVRCRWKELVKSALVRVLYCAGMVSGARAFKYLVELGIREDRICRYYDVVDNNFFSREAVRLRASLSPVLPRSFVFVGRLAPEKNVVGLAQAFQEYRAAGGDWRLRIVGRGPRSGEIESIVTRLGLTDYVDFKGFHEGESLVRQYVECDCLVLPSTREPWGLVVNEAMACGLPVLVSDRCGCAPDLVKEGQNGFTFDPTDCKALTQLMHVISSMSPTRLDRMGKQSAEIIADYSPENWASEAMRLCSKLI